MNLLLDLPPGTSFETIGLQKGDPLCKAGDSLGLGPLRILLGEADIWRPSKPVVTTMSPERLQGRLRALLSGLKSRPDPPGLGPLTDLDASQGKPTLLPPLAARALPSARAFGEGLIHRDVFKLQEGVRGLIGLGPGLTPAGDDFLGGWLTVLRSTEEFGGFSTQELDQTALEIQALAKGKTPLISEALLRCALAGDSSESIHHLLNQVLSESATPTPENLAHWVQEVIKQGHSSGWDALAGIVWGIRSLIDSLRMAVGNDPARNLPNPVSS